MRVLVFGDSIAEGFWDSKGGWADRIKSYYLREALKDIRQRDYAEVSNLGISGDTSKKLLDRIANETKARKWPGEGQIVVIAIGTNDDVLEQSESVAGQNSFKSTLQEIISKVQDSVEHILLVGNPACDESLTNPVFWANVNYTNEQLQKTEQIVSEIAAENGITFVPMFDEFKCRIEAGEKLLEDGLHPNSAGHEVIFKLVQPALDKLLN